MIFDGDLVRERARVTPDDLALVCFETGERLTYRDFDIRVDQAAAALAEAGIAAGERYGILSLNSIDYLALFFAAGRVDAIVVPLSTRATAHELDAIVRDCAMRVLFHTDDFADVAANLPVRKISCDVVQARGASAGPAPADADVRTPASPEIHDPEATYCLLYTSGTTGKPKGVMIPRRQLYWNGYNTVVNWDLHAGDVSPVYTPLYHAGGLAAFLIPLFCVGGTIVLHKSFSVSAVWKSIQEDRCTVVLGVPTIWKMLMDAPEFATADLSHVRAFFSGGAPLPHFIIEAYQKRGVVFKQGFGMTEVGVNCFTMSVADSYRKRGSIGRPMMFTAVKLVDADGREVKVGEIGEMWIRGPHVSGGYWNKREETLSAYGEDGWFHTGDLARCDEEGFFYIAGRRKDMFISGGVNIYPAEIEAELVAHPSVADAAVVSVPDDTWGEVGVAFVVGTATVEELVTFLTVRLAKYKVPRRFVFLDALPRTPYGKVVKEELRKLLQA